MKEQNLNNMIGITIVRNESEVIHETLNHFADICKRGIVVLDDASEDDTADICNRHPAVIGLAKNNEWNEERIHEQGRLRNIVLNEARRFNPEFLFYFDADERPEVDIQALKKMEFDAVALKLFDFYITPEDVDGTYEDRTKIGPEFRDILMLFRDDPSIFFNKSNREPTLPKTYKKLLNGFVKHYGKAISVAEWEKTCDYYDKHMRKQYGDKWAKRKGKAIHTLSDFGQPLITWDEKEEKGIELKSMKI